MADLEKVGKVYAFLREHASSGAAFTADQMATAVGWNGKTAPTYISKHYKDFLKSQGKGSYSVKIDFKRVTFDEFKELVTQVRHVYTAYNRASYGGIVSYEFLLPLTREDKLRRALDSLFFLDSLEARIRESLPSIEKIMPRTAGEGDDAYVARAARRAGALFGGYSISHVSGRFRADKLRRKGKASDAYIVDETTAIVRFIIPIERTRIEHGSTFDVAGTKKTGKYRKALQRIRGLFFELFVEALVRVIRGEALIWIVESSPEGQRLYALERENNG
jgi:hypothetical protein